MKDKNKPGLSQKALERKIELYAKVFKKKFAEEGLSPDIDDIRSEIGLIIAQAIPNYNKGDQRRASIQTFIDRSIKKRMVNYRTRRLLKDEEFQTVSLDCNMRFVDAQHQTQPDDFKILVGDLLGKFDGLNKVLAAEQIMPTTKVMRILRAIDCMSPDGKWENSGKVSRRVFAVAKVYGLRPRTVSQRIKNIRIKAKKVLDTKSAMT